MWKKVRFNDAEAQTHRMIEDVLPSTVRAALRREMEEVICRKEPQQTPKSLLIIMSL